VILGYSNLSRPLTILCIDDNVLLLAMRKALLESSDFKVFTADNGPVGLEIARRERIDVVILDYKLPGMDGGTVAKELRRSCPNIAILLSSGMQEIPESVLLIMDGIVPKGTPSAVLINEVERLTSARARPAKPIPHIEVERKERLEHSRQVSRSKQLRARLRQQRRG
jgi:DNA-binding response OmpR family regulator